MQAGLDSLGAVDLCNALASRFGIQVPATMAFDYPTPAALANFVASKQPQGAASPAVTLQAPRRASAAVSGQIGRADLVDQLQGIVSQVLGAAVSSQQPLMEVSPRCSLPFAGPRMLSMLLM